VEQFLNGALPEEAAKPVEQHLAVCESCLRAAIARRPADPIVNALLARIGTAEGPEREEVIAWIIDRLRTTRAEAPNAAPAGRAEPAGGGESGRPAAGSLGLLEALLSPEGVAQSGPLGWLGPYCLLKVLDKGGMGLVFLAEDSQLNRQVALKVLLPTLMADAQARQRFRREAQAAAALESDHIVPIYHVGEERGIPYLVMPLLRGEPLDRWLERHQPLPVAQILRLGREIASGLAVAHAKGLVHRDIKPANLWLEAPTDRLKILDFGLARPLHDPQRLTQTGWVTGTPAYMAPEQACGTAVDHRADLFSLGAVLYLLCSGKLPFDGPTPTAQMMALTQRTPRPLAELNPNLPSGLANLVMQLLSFDPADRPASAEAVVQRIQAIEEALAGSPSETAQRVATPVGSPRTQSENTSSNPAEALAATPTRPLIAERAQPPRHSAPRPHSRSKLLAGVLAGVAIGAVLAIVWWYNSMGRSAPGGGAAGTPPASDRTTSAGPPAKPGPLPVKVFLLAGQSDMGGRGHIRTLDWLGKDPQHGSLLRKIKNPDGSWVVRSNVWVYYQRDNGLKTGPLTIGYGQTNEEIGPELLFGQVLGDYFPNQILLIKVTQGPMSLAVEGRPPSSGGPRSPGRFYRRMIETTRDVLAHLKQYVPDYQGQGYELAGFVWFQGWNDMIDTARRTEYAFNLTNLIKDLRRDLGVPKLPVVIGEMGVGGLDTEPMRLEFRRAQAAVAGRPEFRGTVVLAPTAKYWDKEADALMRRAFVKGQWTDRKKQEQFETMGSQLEFLYLGSGKVFALMGNSFGEAMKGLCPGAPCAGWRTRLAPGASPLAVW
jgi:serine/threonine protein kinase